MGPNIALDIAVLQTFDAVHACLSGGAADLRKTWISRAETGSTCDRVGVSGAAGGPAGHSENRLRLRRNSRKKLRCKRSRAEWTHPDDYGATQGFARVAHRAAIDAIRYESVRDPEHGAAVAVLRPSCFKARKPLEQHTWFLTVRRAAVIWQREGETFEFDAGAWVASARPQ
jgi:RES domain